LGPEEREAELARLRRQVRKAGRRGDRPEYERLSALYAAQKAEHVVKAHEEYIAERRAARAAERAQRPVEAPRRWRLPAGFGVSPLARERARQGRPDVPVVPVGRPALSPWRRGPMAAEVIWRPGR